MDERLKRARKYLGLSQEFVAVQMGLSCSTLSAIESGRREVTADELDRFSRLYGVRIDELMYGPEEELSDTEMPSEFFSDLSDVDKREILNLVDFKKKYKERRMLEMTEML